MSPSWYDLLDVEAGASTDEVRAAWRSRVAELDPTDRRFALLNEAAAVLLDPARRAAYDAELAARTPAPAPVPVAEPTAVAATSTTMPTTTPTTTPATSSETTSVRRVPAWAPALLGALTLAVAGTAAWFAVEVPTDDEVLAAAQTAQAAAERAVEPVLSYDHRTLDADKAAAASYLTEDFLEEQYEPLFTQIEENAPSTKTVVDAQVRASAITRGGADRAQVLLFVDQVTTNASTTEPVTYRNQVTVTMERVGDRWLIDDLSTTRG